MAEARLAIHDYGTKPVGQDEVKRMLEVFNAEVHLVRIDIPALLFPPIFGKYRLAIQAGLPLMVRRFLALHELGHVLGNEAEEPTVMIHTDPLPESELVCDLFAALGVIDPVHEDEGTDWLEETIRATIPLDNTGWQVHRIPRLAKKLPRVREMVRDLHGYF